MSTRTFAQIITDHTDLLRQIIDEPEPAAAPLTPAQFIGLVGDAQFFTAQLRDGFMTNVSEDLTTVGTYLRDALDHAEDSPEAQVFLKGAHKLLNALDPNDFLY